MLEILLAEDDDDVRESIAGALEDAGHDVARARDGREAEALLDRRVFDVAICDIHMPGTSGLAIARRLRVQAPATAVIVMTSQGTVRDVVEGMRGGAVEFLTKPFEPEVLDRVLRPIDERLALRRCFDQARAQRDDGRTVARIVAQSAPMASLLERLAVAAQDDAPMLLLGEPGTGKKTLARFVHDRGPRRDGPFVVVRCATLPSVMLDSELCALATGSPRRERDAWFRRAEGGTLVLDGVDALRADAQMSLVRVLAEADSIAGRDEARRPRGVRIVATASEGAVDRVRRGECVAPLFFRLAGLVAQVPPLRDRTGDLLPLTAEILARLSTRSRSPSILPEAWRRLSSYAFPGNVAELACALQWALLKADGSPIDASDLPPRIAGAFAKPA